MAEHKRACSDSCHRHRRGWITSVQLADNLMARRGKSEPNHLLRTHTSCAPQPVNVANWKCHQVRTRYTDVVQPQTVALFFFPLPRLCVPLRVTWQGSREKGKVTGFSEETMVQVTLMQSCPLTPQQQQWHCPVWMWCVCTSSERWQRAHLHDPHCKTDWQVGSGQECGHTQ